MCPFAVSMMSIVYVVQVVFCVDQSKASNQCESMDADLMERFDRLDREIHITQALLAELDAEWVRYQEEKEEDGDSDAETIVEEWEDPFKTPPSGYSPVPDHDSDVGE